MQKEREGEVYWSTYSIRYKKTIMLSWQPRRASGLKPPGNQHTLDDSIQLQHTQSENDLKPYCVLT